MLKNRDMHIHEEDIHRIFSAGNGPNYIQLEENDLRKGGQAGLSSYNLSVLPEDLVQDSFHMVAESPVEFRYPHGSCHERAHLMSLLLKKAQVPHLKIWIFAPSRMIAASKQKLWVEDPLKLTKKSVIQWGYHVAPLVVSENAVLVLDPSLFPAGPVDYREWLSHLNCNAVFFTVVDPDWYSFNSFNGLTIYQPGRKKNTYIKHELPSWFPDIITGDFFPYEGTPRYENWLGKGLAVLDTAYLFYAEELQKANEKRYSSKVQQEFKQLLGQIQNVEALFKYHTQNRLLSENFLKRHSKLISEYQQIYDEAQEKWRVLIDRLL